MTRSASGVCDDVKSCPANKKEGYDGYFNNFSIKKYFLGYNKDNKIRCESSSGGCARH